MSAEALKRIGEDLLEVCRTFSSEWNCKIRIEIICRFVVYLAMSDVSDLAPLPSTPSHHGDHLDMEMPSPSGSFILLG